MTIPWNPYSAEAAAREQQALLEERLADPVHIAQAGALSQAEADRGAVRPRRRWRRLGRLVLKRT